MKAVVFFVVCLATSAFTAVLPEDLMFEAEARMVMARMAAQGITPRDLADNIRQKLDEFFLSFNDPSFTELKEIDGVYFNETLALKGAFTNTTIRGVHDYVIDPLSFVTIPPKFDMTMVMNNVQTDGLYEIDGAFAALVPLFGKGAFNLAAEKVRVIVNVVLTSRGGYLVVKSLNFYFDLEDVSVSLTNFLGGLGDVLGEVLEDNTADYIRRVFYAYGVNINDMITEKTNEFLFGKSLQDLIDWINGVSTPAPPMH